MWQRAGVKLAPPTVPGAWRTPARPTPPCTWVEGETDSLAAWQNGLACSGAARGPGDGLSLPPRPSASLRRSTSSASQGRDGRYLPSWRRSRLADLDFTGDASEMRMPDGIKDLADLHSDDPKRFAARLEKARSDSKLLPPPGEGGQGRGPHSPDRMRRLAAA